MLQHFSPARSTITSANMTSLSHSLSVPEPRLKWRLEPTALKNTSRRSFVSLHAPPIRLPNSVLNISLFYVFLAKAIDRYIQLRCQEQTGKREKLDPRLQTIIEGIFKQCIDEGDYTQVNLTLCTTITSALTDSYIGHWYRSRIASA